MSQENVEVVRRGIKAWNRGDMDAMLASLHPDVEYVTGVFPGLDPVYRGHDGFRKFWQDFVETWESISIDIDALRAASERVLVRMTFNARGRDGVDVHRQVARLVTFRDGVVVRYENYAGWTTALEAAGLPE
jgi:ketosteroid isomerase-like protein